MKVVTGMWLCLGVSNTITVQQAPGSGQHRWLKVCSFTSLWQWSPPMYIPCNYICRGQIRGLNYSWVTRWEAWCIQKEIRKGKKQICLDAGKAAPSKTVEGRERCKHGWFNSHEMGVELLRSKTDWRQGQRSYWVIFGRVYMVVQRTGTTKVRRLRFIDYKAELTHCAQGLKYYDHLYMFTSALTLSEGFVSGVATLPVSRVLWVSIHYFGCHGNRVVTMITEVHDNNSRPTQCPSWWNAIAF